jgi:ribosomal protein S15P/S13E
MNRKKKSKSAFEQLFQLIDESPSHSVKPLLKIYNSLLQAEKDFFKVTKALKYFETESSIPLNTIKALVNQLDAIIGVLGHITLVTEPRIDEASIVLEINNKLDLKKPHQVEYIERRIRKLVSSIVRSCKDKHFQSCLDQQKEKAWRLLEALDEYAKAQYKQSIF